MDKKVRIGIIGFGGIARGAHLPGYKKCADEVEITAVCDIDDNALAAAATACNLPQDRLFKNYKNLIACAFVDAVDICTPNYVHCEIATDAVNAGKPFSVEKPVGINYDEVLALYNKAQNAGIPAFVCFTWRYRQYIRYIKSIIDKGVIGKLYHVYIRCIKESGLWKGRKLEWRFDKDKAGSGVLGDLGSHMIDITRFLGEEFESVCANSGTIVPTRQKIGSDENGKADYGEVTTDDWCNIIGMLKSGASVTIALSRCANTIEDLIEFELYGEKGAIKYTYMNGAQSIEYSTPENKRQILVPPESFSANQSKSYIDLINGKVDAYTSQLIHGLECQKVIDAALKSTVTGGFVKID
ncbi:MAG: Gfo/Idh/MocA family oxidoreductase [Oscillospiraceae bacterium]|nr:Gfo/Idh/MocA family oxidoreductase [Oscillospiraceae bacterium]